MERENINHKGSQEWLSEATVTAQRISRMYSNPDDAAKINDILNQDPGSDEALMLVGSESGGKIGVQKWFETEIQNIATISGPRELATHYSRMAKKLQRLEEYIKRM